jgi:hypothetical protein
VDLARHPAEVAEGTLQPVQPGRLPLVLERCDEVAARVAERRDEQPDPLGRATDLDRGRAEVDLQLPAGWRLEPHRRPRLGLQLPAPRRHRPLDRPERDDDPLRERIHGWLEAEPGLSGQAVLARLTALAPARFKDTQLRTVQRAVKAWRAESARKIILTGAGTLTIAQPVDLMDEPSASPTAPQALPPPPPAALIETGNHPTDPRPTPAAVPGNIAT